MMKSIKQALLGLSLFFTIIYSANAQIPSLSGNQMCLDMEEYLIKHNFLPEKSELISTTSNNFPQNLVVNFDSRDPLEKNHLIICIPLDQAYTHPDIVLNILTDLKFRNFSSSVLFLYDFSSRIPGVRNYNGLDNYLKNINSTDENYALIIRFDAEETQLVTSSYGRTSPSFLVNNAFDAFINNELSEYLPIYYLSQLSGLFFNNETVYSSFSSQNIPSISFKFNSNFITSERISNTVTSFIDLFELSSTGETDYHSLIFRIGNSKFCITEYSIVKILVITILLSLFFMFILSFINSNLKNQAWEEIRKDWFSIPITLALTIISFYLARWIYNASYKPGSDATPFGLVIFQILLSSALVSIFYWFEVSVRKKDYGERSVDFLVLIVTFVNQFIFCLADISLFPLFMLICLLSTLSLILKRNWFHIILFIFMILIYLPYVILIYHTADGQSLRFFLSRSNASIFAISFILLPIFLMWFRILTAIRKRITRKRHFAIIISSSYIFIFISLIIPNYTTFNGKKSGYNFPDIVSQDDPDSDMINLDYSIKKVFGETINTITIETPMQAQAVILQVSSDIVVPVLYSDDEYNIDNTKTASFKIPSNPPKKMQFVFGSIGNSYSIKAQVYYRSFTDNQYYSYVREIKTQGN